MVGKIRADQRVVDLGLADSRARAQALIMGGHIFTAPHAEKRIDKAGQQVAADCALLLKGGTHPWVSRGGIKLDVGLKLFDIEPAGQVCLDVGASTGGFTDVLLHFGAKRVFAVDVGHGQLAWKLRNDPRVEVLEKTNARHLNTDLIPEPPSIVVCDASFIGLRKVLPQALELAAPGARLIALIKPQFEAGREHVGSGGVVRDPAAHERVCADIRAWLDGLPNWKVIGIAASPIDGPAGNKEFLVGAEKHG